MARFRTVKCTSSNKTFNANITCSIKAYDRYAAKLTVLVNFDVKTYQILFDSSVMYKQPVGTSYRVLINKTADICGHLGGKSDVLLEWYLKLLWKELPPSLLHPCPYIVSYLTFAV
ncbi:hypothetical protein ACKWTF_014313 [Chironomus riparius]